jgi:hypothetical protein
MRCDIGSEPEKHGVAKRQKPAKSEHQIESASEERKTQNLGKHKGVEAEQRKRGEDSGEAEEEGRVQDR